MGAQSFVLSHVCVQTVSPPPPPATTRHQVQPFPVPGPFTKGPIFVDRRHDGSRKGKVVFVMGSTGTGKSRLSIDLATHFGGEVVNSDKMQVHRGLDITTNKVTAKEQAGICHHLLGTIDPDQEFSSADFRCSAIEAVNMILARSRLPIIAGGSNSYIEALVDGENKKFRSMYECCFLWVDVYLPVLYSFVSERVDRMVEAGMIDEVRQMFDLNNKDYSSGLRRAIGFPEFDRILRDEAAGPTDDTARARLKAIEEVKENTRRLAARQLEKIKRLSEMQGWKMKKLDATEVFLRRGVEEEADQAWEKLVARPSIEAVAEFLNHKDEDDDDDDNKEADDNNNEYFKLFGGINHCIKVGGAAAAATPVAVARAN